MQCQYGSRQFGGVWWHKILAFSSGPSVRRRGGFGGLCGARRGHTRFSLALRRGRRSRRAAASRAPNAGRRGGRAAANSSLIATSTFRALHAAPATPA